MSQQIELKSLMAGDPTPEALNRVNALILHKSANYVFFFEKLDNPRWLQPLEQQGHFSNLPGPEPTANGQIGYRIHVPLVALNQMAKTAPVMVTNIIIKLQIPDNRRVGDQILQCMANIEDPICIPLLRPLVVQLTENPGLSSWLWIEQLLDSWVKLGAIEDACAVGQAFLNAAVDASFNRDSDPDAWLTEEIDKKVLGPLGIIFPLKILGMVFGALCRWAEHSRQQYKPIELKDDSPFTDWLEDFKDSPHSYRTLEITLALRLFATSEVVYREGDHLQIATVDKMLRSNPWRLFQRLRWQLYADYPKLSADNAREDVLKRIPFVNQFDFRHDYEFAQLLLTHCAHYGGAFLAPDYVTTFVANVLKGPVDNCGRKVEGCDEHTFQFKQVWPIAALLNAGELATYKALVPVGGKMDVRSYRPFPSHVESFEVVSVCPIEVVGLDVMDDGRLWYYLNTWEPKSSSPTAGKWYREDIGALGTKFAELVAARPERFTASRKWWQHIERAEILGKVFQNATDHFIKKQNDQKGLIPAPTDNDWGNWFGLARFIMVKERSTELGSEGQSPESDWPWPRQSVATFLRMALKSNYNIPTIHLSGLKQCFEELLSGEARMSNANEKPTMRDWFTTAINSVEGNVMEAMLSLASRQKKSGKGIESWIFEVIRGRLESPNTSAALFALFGANLSVVRWPHCLPCIRPSTSKPWLGWPNARTCSACYFFCSLWVLTNGMRASLELGAMPWWPYCLRWG